MVLLLEREWKGHPHAERIDVRVSRNMSSLWKNFDSSIVYVQGVTRKRHISWLTIDHQRPRIWAQTVGDGEGGLRGLSQWVQLYTWSSNKLWRSTSLFTVTNVYADFLTLCQTQVKENFDMCNFQSVLASFMLMSPILYSWENWIRTQRAVEATYLLSNKHKFARFTCLNRWFTHLPEG